MSNRKPLGWYVVNAKGQQCAWASSRQTARKLLDKLARDFPGECPFYTVADVRG